MLALHYRSVPDRNETLREEIQDLAHRHKRYGADIIHLIAATQPHGQPQTRRATVCGDGCSGQVFLDTTIGIFTPPGIPAEQAIGGKRLTRILDQLALTRDLPKVIRTENDKEFFGRDVLAWAHHRMINLRLIEPGKLNQNAYIESFNGRFRDEHLNEHWFANVSHAQMIIEK